ncbi:MAG: hypothetical protein N4A53_11755 [Pelagimonas sp.]|jgi:hypothetical protein|nr:hypothetical protein [Pelagimonas sp.]
MSASPHVWEHGVTYGLGGANKVVSATAAEEIAKIANWATGGGAPTTATRADHIAPARDEPVDNYEFGYEKKPHSLDLGDSDIPF